jgi:hypothetical protein
MVSHCFVLPVHRSGEKLRKGEGDASQEVSLVTGTQNMSNAYILDRVSERPFACFDEKDTDLGVFAEA